MLPHKLPLTRDDHSHIYFSFLHTKTSSKNNFQLTNQLSLHHTYKPPYHLTILINRLPLLQLQFKPPPIHINHPFNQLKPYPKQNYTPLFP
ncbi:type I restriction enzyme HsdR N-terminal domain-containing protein, partial [Staphylococcus aureus]|uniref:type I restriction enzyme HsdR N-terminal domain-containing protein n=1 Tax=Staphylococcus aureus TaxID=1280 RepID=UPI0037D9C148